MRKLKLWGAAAIVSTAITTPAMTQEATQEPGMIGFNYANADYLTGGWGVHTPDSRYRLNRRAYYPYVYYGRAYPYAYYGGPYGPPFDSFDSYAYYWGPVYRGW